MTGSFAVRSLIKIYGERNTNTNYLQQLIDSNLGVRQIPGTAPSWLQRAQIKAPGTEWLIDAYFSMTFGQNLGWKHRCAPSPDEIGRSAFHDKSALCFVTVVKNPYSWALSLYRSPYHYRGGVASRFEDFLTRPWKPLSRDHAPSELATPIDLWNEKNRSYENLLSLNVLQLTTEELFAEPAAVIAKISETFNVSRTSETFVNYERSTKASSRSFTDYQDYYLSERWREKLSSEAIGLINARVDQGLMKHYGYELLSS